MTSIINTVHRQLTYVVDDAKERSLRKKNRWTRYNRMKKTVAGQAKLDAAYVATVKRNIQLGVNPRAWKEQHAYRNEHWFKELGAHSAKIKARKKVNVDDKRKAREDVERHAADALRDAVASIEGILHKLIDTPAPTQYEKFINQGALYNALAMLKTRCGVKFDDTFAHKKQDLAPSSNSFPAEASASDMQYLREIRKRHEREQAERFAAWKNKSV